MNDDLFSRQCRIEMEDAQAETHPTRAQVEKKVDAEIAKRSSFPEQREHPDKTAIDTALLERASDPLAQRTDQLKTDFEEWKQTPGANHVLQDLYRLAAKYGDRFKRNGRRVSMKLLWELERDRIKWVRMRLKMKGVDLKPWNGYALNNNFHSLIARHIMDHREDWKGLFELRERKS